MAGVRGVKNPMPTKGGAPTGIFSTGGKQKADSNAGCGHQSLKDYSLANHDHAKPVKRDNRIKG